MVRSNVKTYKYKVGKNNFIVINIFQTSQASAEQGNVLASNAATVQIVKQSKSKKSRSKKG
ncbi:hypothetical protein [Paenibacillus harenae]|uniref:hypothetical protein n=1 Tax=Paenibacillus harenae TaxID=306543 RepID=UPI000403F9E1|nr:hypothetical protein [Paenibacillus harenae]